jgi:hypothetical protein
MLLEAELATRDGELRNFSLARDRLVAFGKDANAAYRQIFTRRDAVAAKLRRLRTPTPDGPRGGIALVSICRSLMRRSRR